MKISPLSATRMSAGILLNSWVRGPRRNFWGPSFHSRRPTRGNTRAAFMCEKWSVKLPRERSANVCLVVRISDQATQAASDSSVISKAQCRGRRSHPHTSSLTIVPCGAPSTSIIGRSLNTANDTLRSRAVLVISGGGNASLGVPRPRQHEVDVRRRFSHEEDLICEQGLAQADQRLIQRHG